TAPPPSGGLNSQCPSRLDEGKQAMTTPVITGTDEHGLYPGGATGVRSGDHHQTGSGNRQALRSLSGRRVGLPERAGATAVDALLVGPVHVARPAEPFEQADHGGGRVELVAVEAVAGAAGLAVVAVVPAFAEGQQGQRPQVRRAVVASGLEGPGADDVAHGVDAPGDVLEQRDADQSRPEEGGQPAEQG